MNKFSEQHGYMAFRALQAASHALRADGFHAHATEVDAMALRLREILYETKDASADGRVVKRIDE